MKVKGIEALKEIRKGSSFEFKDAEGRYLGLVDGDLYYGGDEVLDESSISDVDFEIVNLYDIQVDLDELTKNMKATYSKNFTELEKHLEYIGRKDVFITSKDVDRLALLYKKREKSEFALGIIFMLTEKDTQKRMKVMMDLI